jgi:Ca2+-binding RTX toxin-like protein
MTTFVFENMSSNEAADFTSSDTLIFSSATLQPSDVSALNSDNGLGLTFLTAGSKTLVFSDTALSSASNANQVKFTSAFVAGKNDSLLLGSFGNNSNLTIDNADNGNIAYGFKGNDGIFGNNGADNIFGGGGADTIDGGSGNDHIYGFALTGTLSDDGADSLAGGDGNDYIQGNAGADVIDGGNDNDRLNGGADNDLISGGNGNDTVNGNKGEDNISGGAGNDSIRGGADNDVLNGGSGNDIILGDLGNDVITGGTGLDLVTGGAGADTFSFAAGDASFTTGTDPLAYFADTITDFTDGTDKLALPTFVTMPVTGIGLVAGDVLHAQAGIVLTSVTAALTYAQQLLDAHAGGTDVAVLEVGSDAYLFYNGAGSTAEIDSLIKLTGVDAAVITSADIVGSA